MKLRLCALLPLIVLGCQMESKQFGSLVQQAAILAGEDAQKAARYGQAATKAAEAKNALLGDVPLKTEIAIGQSVAVQAFSRFGPLVRNDALLRYVALVGNTVAYTSDRPDIEYHFAVIQNDLPNAFSAPGGFIFVTTGTLRAAKDESELAGILGHEIAHVSQKHALKVIQRNKFLGSAAEAAALIDGRNPAQFTNIVDVATEYVLEKGFDRRLEYEADRLGVQFVYRAGYNPEGLQNFLMRLTSKSGPSGWTPFKTHGDPDDRARRLRVFVSQNMTGYARFPKLAARYRKYVAPALAR